MVNRGPRACGDDPTLTLTTGGHHTWSPRLQGAPAHETVETSGLNSKTYAGAELVALGKVIAERARQVQNGETPTAKL
ncbi:hypothetical protein [Streptomyces tsukubensis]